MASGFDTLISIENLTGSANGDTLIGNNKVNILDGGDGDDIVIGAAGGDELIGGNGEDRFTYTSTGDSTNSTRDTITDFTDGEDKIDVSDIDAKTSSGADDDFIFRGTAAFSGAGQIRVEKSGTDTIVYFNTNSSDGPEMVLILENTAPADLSANDFIL